MAIIKAKIRTVVERLTKLHIYRVLPHGINVLHDINVLLPKSIPTVIFDVGANVGQSSKQYVEWFPKAKTYSFEPVSSIFDELRKNLAQFDNIFPFQLAFSGVQGQANITRDLSHSGMNSLNVDNIPAPGSTEMVDLETIDNFCHTQGIVKISFLKVDTEGYDLEVLKGAENMLETQMIDIVQVEAGMNPRNCKFIPWEQFKDHLESKGYYLFGIYEQLNECFSGEPHLRRANMVYISDIVIKANKSLSRL